MRTFLNPRSGRPAPRHRCPKARRAAAVKQHKHAANDRSVPRTAVAIKCCLTDDDRPRYSTLRLPHPRNMQERPFLTCAAGASPDNTWSSKADEAIETWAQLHTITNPPAHRDHVLPGSRCPVKRHQRYGSLQCTC